MGVEAVEKPKFFIELRIFDRLLITQKATATSFIACGRYRFLGIYAKGLQCVHCGAMIKI
jgi:hypothetical protein